MTDPLDRLTEALSSRYTIEREIGRGGMAVVYLAEDVKHHRKVAVKVLRPELAAALGPERFIREIEVTANLHHPHILPLYDSGEADGFLYYVMPYVEGESLRDRLSREKQLPIDDSLRITGEVADALGFAHDNNVIHRDIKPENILLEANHAVVADFGIAVAVSVVGGDRLTETGFSLGTPEYMSPEQATADEVDGRSDVYSAACVLYEMLVGEPPYTGRTAQAVIAKRFADPVPSARRLREIPQSVNDAIRSALAKVPADRFATARAFAEALLNPHDADVVVPSKSIAALPFANLSADPEMEYFSDGMTEEIINALTQLEDLRVAARTSSFWFKGKSPEIAEVGEKLNVATVLEGSVRRAGNRLRITAQLVKVADGYHLWSERYDRDMEDVFAIQDEIATTIADRLSVTLGKAESEALVTAPTENLRAYDLYLKGCFFLDRRTVPSMRQALECFTQALALDADYALAYGGLADTQSLLGFYGGEPVLEIMPQAEASARRALQLDDRRAEAHNALAIVSMFKDWDSATAADEFRVAIDLDPHYHQPRVWYPFFCLACFDGAFDHAVADVRRAGELFPFSGYVAAMQAMVLGMAGLFEEGAKTARDALDREPDYYLAWRSLALVYQWQGEHSNALTAFQKALDAPGRHQWVVAERGMTYAALGKTAEAEAAYGELIGRGQSELVQSSFVAMLLGAMGRKDEAFSYLDRAFTEHDPILAIAKRWPGYEPLRHDPRWSRLMERMGWE